MKVDHVALLTSTSLAIGTCASLIATASAVSTIGLVSLGIFSTALGAFSIASVTAYFSDRRPHQASIRSYFGTVLDHAHIGTMLGFEFVSKIMLNAVITGIARGLEISIQKNIEKRLSPTIR